MTGCRAPRATDTRASDKTSARGTYALLAHMDKAAAVETGRLGLVTLGQGWYVYAGSALGPGGLAARLARHRRSEKRLHWHIDYLLDRAVLVGSWYLASPTRLECAWAGALRDLEGARLPAPGFGASDCRCVAHLVHLARRPVRAVVSRALTAASPPGCVVRYACYANATGR